MSESTDQALARERALEDHDAKAIEAIADALGGLGYELISGLQVAQFLREMAVREMARWVVPGVMRATVREPEEMVYVGTPDGSNGYEMPASELDAIMRKNREAIE